MSTPLVALTIAGSDSAGGAGLHADLRTFAAHGFHGASAIAAVTAQDTRGIRLVHRVPASVVRAQIDAVARDLDVRAAKTGFLGDTAVVHAVAEVTDELTDAGRFGDLVVDPVLVSAGGDRLFGADVEAAYREALVPRARVITPNRLEAGLLTGRPVETVADMEAAALTLLELGPDLVVVKGGDAVDETRDAVDAVASRRHGARRLVLPMVDTPNDHGTGCTFAAATVCRLAAGDEPMDAVLAAKRFVHAALEGAARWRMGVGHGPIDQLGWGDRR